MSIILLPWRSALRALTGQVVGLLGSSVIGMYVFCLGSLCVAMLEERQDSLYMPFQALSGLSLCSRIGVSWRCPFLVMFESFRLSLLVSF